MELKHVGLCCFSGCALCSCAPRAYTIPVATQRYLLGNGLHYKQESQLNSEVNINRRCFPVKSDHVVCDTASSTFMCLNDDTTVWLNKDR